MRKTTLLLFFLLTFSAFKNSAQSIIGFKMPEDKDRIEIPVEIINNLVIVPVTINRFLPLKFVLDTGVETAILTEPDFAPLLQVEFIRQITISGAGIRDSINAYVGHGLVYDLPGGISGRNMNMLVLDDNYLHLAEKLGRDVHGIIGFDLFNAFVVEINYEEGKLILHKPSKYRVRKRYSCIKLEMRNSRPFIYTSLSQEKTHDDSVKLMIDSGASHAVLLDATQTKINVPEKTIDTHLGTGIGGEIPGKLGRVDDLQIESFDFKDVLVSMPNADSYSQAIKRGSRQGTLGGEILSRLNPIFDYQNEKIYFNKGRLYKKAFEYDMSGMVIVAKGTFLDTLTVEYVEKESPAKEADIRQGDIILTMNGHNLNSASLNDLIGMLKRRPKKKIKLRILRDGERLKKVFRLRRAI